MSWKAITECSIWGTNTPVEWILHLRFKESYRAIRDTVAAEEEHLRDGLRLKEILRAIRFDREHRKNWIRIISGLAKQQDIGKSLGKVVGDETIEKSVRMDLVKWQQQRELLARQMESIRDIFDRELRAMRDALWNLAKVSKVQSALFTLNPTFYTFVRDHLSTWGKGPRTQKMREREKTLVSYLARICAKGSVVGAIGPTFKGIFPESPNDRFSFKWKPEAVQDQGIGRRESFFSHWGARALAHAMQSSRDIQSCLPLLVHPAVEIEGLRMISMLQNMVHESLPEEPEVDISDSLARLLRGVDGKRSALRLIADAGIQNVAEHMKDFHDLIMKRFLHVGLDIPPGELSPLTYLQRRLDQADPVSEEVVRWKTSLARFEIYQKAFKTVDHEKQNEILLQVENLFATLTGRDQRQGAGLYYADRFLLYEDCERSAEPLELGAEVAREIREHYTIGLELIAPLWLFRIVPSVMNSLRFQEQICEEDVRDMPAAQRRLYISEFLKKYLDVPNEPISDEIKSDERALNWLGSISELVRMTEELFSSIDRSAREVIISPDDPRIDLYRKRFRELMIENSPRLPVFASGPILQIAATSGAAIAQGDYRLVFDSTIFGNSMHLTVLNYFATDRLKMMRRTEEIINQLTQRETSRLADFASVFRQESKFTPYLSAGLDIECLGRSCKPEGDRVALHNLVLGRHEATPIRARVGSSEVPIHLLFPNTIRVSRKLIYERFEEHYPRISVGKTVIQREQWKMSGSSVLQNSPKEHDSFLEFVDAIRFQMKKKLPDLVFVDPSGPKKNIMIDFQNFFLVEVLFGLARENDELRISEMLPGPHEFWMEAPDNNGHYTVGLMPFLYYDLDESNLG